MCPTKPEIFTIPPFTEQVCQSLVCIIRGGNDRLEDINLQRHQSAPRMIFSPAVFFPQKRCVGGKRIEALTTVNYPGQRF